MLTPEQNSLVELLASDDPAKRATAEMFVATSMLTATSGDESLVPGLLRMMARALERGIELPGAMRRFTALSLARAAQSQDAVRRIAGTEGKRGRKAKPSRDGQIWWRYAELRAAGLTTEAAEARIAQEHHLSPEAVNSITDKLRASTSRADAAIKAADELLKNG